MQNVAILLFFYYSLFAFLPRSCGVQWTCQAESSDTVRIYPTCSLTRIYCKSLCKNSRSEHKNYRHSVFFLHSSHMHANMCSVCFRCAYFYSFYFVCVARSRYASKQRAFHCSLIDTHWRHWALHAATIRVEIVEIDRPFGSCHCCPLDASIFNVASHASGQTWRAYAYHRHSYLINVHNCNMHNIYFFLIVCCFSIPSFHTHSDNQLMRRSDIWTGISIYLVDQHYSTEHCHSSC